MKKADVRLGMIIILIALGMLLVLHLIDRSGNDDGCMIRITIDGEEYGVYLLDENQEIEVNVGNFYNKICISDGEAYMEEANCPDAYCIKQGNIKRQTQTIVCLPHKLIVEVIEGEQNNESDESEIIPDAVVK